MADKPKILITTYVALERGGVASSSIVVECDSAVEANKMMNTLVMVETNATRVHYDAVWLNRGLFHGYES